jgi:predicted flavoprotein YhiN
MQEFDVAIVGAGAAGLFCASVAGQLGLRVVPLPMALPALAAATVGTTTL